MSDFIDYVTLMLLNVISALVILAFFLWWGLGRAGRRSWAPAFGIAGLVATVSGFAMTFTRPIPQPYSMAYGAMSVLLGALFLGAAWTLARGWSLLPLSIYAFFCGAAAIWVSIAYMAYWQHLQVQPPANGTTSAESRGDTFEPDGTAAVLPMLRLLIPSREGSRPV